MANEGDVVSMAVSEHVENAGVHSGELLYTHTGNQDNHVHMELF